MGYKCIFFFFFFFCFTHYSVYSRVCSWYVDIGFHSCFISRFQDSRLGLSLHCSYCDTMTSIKERRVWHTQVVLVKSYYNVGCINVIKFCMREMIAIYIHIPWSISWVLAFTNSILHFRRGWWWYYQSWAITWVVLLIQWPNIK